VFIHDPRKGVTLAERFSLEGNPSIQQDWATQTITYTDADGMMQLKEVAFTPANFALLEGRFKKHFKVIPASDDLVEVAEYIKLSDAERLNKSAFIWSTDNQQKLIRLLVTAPIVALVEERLRNWRMLQYISGQQLVKVEKDYQTQLKQWQQRYQQAITSKEEAIDSIANGLAELAMTSGAFSPAQSIPVMEMNEQAVEAPATICATAKPLVTIDAAEQCECTDCKTCYQQVDELFEKVTIIDNGVPKTVSRVIPGALDSVEMTDDLIKRSARIVDQCDAEIIHFNAPTAQEA